MYIFFLYYALIYIQLHKNVGIIETGSAVFAPFPMVHAAGLVNSIAFVTEGCTFVSMPSFDFTKMLQSVQVYNNLDFSELILS